MQAVVLSPSRDPELVDRPDPRPAADEVVIHPHYCGICGSDLHAKENQVYGPGVVLGHEFADGGMAELVALHTSYLQPLPDGLDTRRAGMGQVTMVEPSTDPFTAITREASILTGYIYVEEEFAQAVLLLASGAVDVDTLTTAVVPLERFADACAALRQPESTMKVLLGPKQSTGGSEATTTV